MWDATPPDSGELVKVAVPEEAARQLLQAGEHWAMMSGVNQVPAVLIGGISGGDQQPVYGLAFTSSAQAKPGDLVAVIDRGTSPAALNELSFRFASQRVCCKVHVEGSKDGKAYQSIGPDQLVYQEVADGRLIALTDVKLDPQQLRFIRVTIFGAGGVVLKEIQGRLRKDEPFTAQVPVTLGPSVAGPTAGELVWPLTIANPQDLIMRLDLLGDAPGTACEFSIAALDDQHRPLRTVARGVWVDRLQAGGVERSEHGLELPGLDPMQSYGVITSGKNPPVFTSVKASKRQLWLAFYMPADTSLQLVINPKHRTASPNTVYPVHNAITAGVIGQLVCSAPVTPLPSAVDSTENTMDDWQTTVLTWWRTAAYAAGAVILLLFAGVLLHKRREEDSASG